MRWAIILALVVGVSGSADAGGFKQGQSVLSLNFGAVWGDTLGYGFGLVYDNFHSVENRSSMGGTFMFTNTTADVTVSGLPYQETLNSNLFYIHWKYWLGNLDRGPVLGYFGIGPGVHFSQLNTTATNVATGDTGGTGNSSTENASGLSVFIPVGGLIFFSNTIHLSLNYTFVWENNSLVDSNVMNLLTLGLGFALN